MRNTAALAALLSALLIGLFWWWFQADVRMLLGYSVLALAATASVPLVYRLTGFVQQEEHAWLEQREADEHAHLTDRLANLRTELAELDLPQGVQQADTLRDMLQDYQAVVETRFLGKKHSPLAYLSAARQVQKYAVQNLADAVAVAHSLASISRQSPPSDDQERHSRLQQLQDEQQTRLEGVFEQNRQYFDALTDTAVEVANIPSFSAYERLDTLARLVSLAEIAQNRGTA